MPACAKVALGSDLTHGKYAGAPTQINRRSAVVGPREMRAQKKRRERGRRVAAHRRASTGEVAHTVDTAQPGELRVSLA
jgi:hypothetical protein